MMKALSITEKKFFIAIALLGACQPAVNNSTLTNTSIMPNSLAASADLGQGYFPEKEVFGGRCVTFETETMPNQEGGCNLTYTSSSSEIQQSLGFSGSAKGRYGITKASSSASFARQSMSDEKEMNLIGYCKFVHDKVAIKDATVKPVGSRKNWETRCGSEVVYQKARGASLYLAVKIRFSSESERERFRSEIGANFANFGSLKASLEKASSSFSTSAVIETEALQLGGETGTIGRALAGMTKNPEEEKKEISAITTCSMANPEACKRIIDNFLHYAYSQTPEGFGYQARNFPADIEYYAKPWSTLDDLPTPLSRGVTTLFATKRAIIDERLDEYLRNLVTIERLRREQSNQTVALDQADKHLRNNERIIYDAIKACWDDFIPNNRENEQKCLEKSNLQGIKEIDSSVFFSGENGRKWPLSSFHQGCNAPDKARTPECISAAYRYCKANGYNIGLPQFKTAYDIGVSCLRGADRHDVSYETLRSFHGDCNGAYSSECIAATHRYCSTIGYGAGIGQELGEGVVGVACFNPSLYTDVSHHQLADLDAGCRPNNSQSLSCTTAAHRWCSLKGYPSGLIQEVGQGVYGVACTNSKLQSVPIN